MDCCRDGHRLRQNACQSCLRLPMTYINCSINFARLFNQCSMSAPFHWHRPKYCTFSHSANYCLKKQKQFNQNSCQCQFIFYFLTKCASYLTCEFDLSSSRLLGGTKQAHTQPATYISWAESNLWMNDTTKYSREKTKKKPSPATTTTNERNMLLCCVRLFFLLQALQFIAFSCS